LKTARKHAEVYEMRESKQDIYEKCID